MLLFFFFEGLFPLRAWKMFKAFLGDWWCVFLTCVIMCRIMAFLPRSALRSSPGPQSRPMITPPLQRAAKAVRRARAVRGQRRKKAPQIGNTNICRSYEFSFNFIFKYITFNSSCKTVILFNPLTLQHINLLVSATGMWTQTQSTPWWFMMTKARGERENKQGAMGIRPCRCRGWVVCLL